MLKAQPSPMHQASEIKSADNNDKVNLGTAAECDYFHQATDQVTPASTEFKSTASAASFFGNDVESAPDDHTHRLSAWDLNLPVKADQTRTSTDLVTVSGPSTLGSKDGKLETSTTVVEIKEIDNSPYEEVRAAVPNTDEDLPANTIRAWVLGLFFTACGTTINTIFTLRSPPIQLGVIVVQVIAFLVGRLWSKLLPNRAFNTLGLKWNLNPGPFNIKEHSVICTMAGVSFGTSYATEVLVAQIAFYKQNFGLAFQLLLVITTQCIGYGIAGLLRKVLVYPAAMLWPSILVGTRLLHVMHARPEPRDATVFGGSMSPYRWFGVVCLCSGLWYFIPGFLFRGLSALAFVTWILPKNVLVNQLFGSAHGLSLIPLTLDWTTVIGFVGNPMVPPWFATANSLVGVFIFYIVGAAVLHYSNSWWYAQYLPLSTVAIHDNRGMTYNTSRILTDQLTLNETAYQQYSPLFISSTFAMSYGLSFATFATLIVYCILNYRHQVISSFKASRIEDMDIHRRLMLKYAEVPVWWYIAIFIVMLALSYVTILVWPTQFSAVAFTLAIIFASVMAVPLGVVQAITNQQIGLNVITEFMMGFAQPGKPLALMLFKTYGYITAVQALGFVQDMKFGHYMKIPPRTMFMAQVVATIFSCFIQIFVLNYALKKIPDVCTVEQEQNFSCPGGRIHYSSATIWGALGPQRMFAPGQVYSALLFCFPFGIVVAILLWLVQKRWPQSVFKYAMAPLILDGGTRIPPASPLNYLTYGMIGFLFQKYIRTRYPRWWTRSNYLTACGLDTGLAISTLFMFLAFSMNDIHPPKWWGNNVVKTTLDQNGVGAVRVNLPPGETFGPSKW